MCYWKVSAICGVVGCEEGGSIKMTEKMTCGTGQHSAAILAMVGVYPEVWIASIQGVRIQKRACTLYLQSLTAHRLGDYH
jgi:hypothetical protein